MGDLFDVSGKIVVVTGGLGQLGRQFTLALADLGARVAVFDVDASRERVAERFGERSEDQAIMFLEADVTDRGSIEGALSRLNDGWGVPHGLVNNAALDSPPNAPIEENGPFERYPEKSWDRVMEVNLKGVFQCCQVVGGQMAEAGRGSIISVCSIYGLVSPDQRLYEYRRATDGPFFKPVAYSASKSGLLNLTRYLATYWADRNVRGQHRHVRWSLQRPGRAVSGELQRPRAPRSHGPRGRVQRRRRVHDLERVVVHDRLQPDHRRRLDGMVAALLGRHE